MICPSVKVPELEAGKKRKKNVGFLKTKLRLGQVIREVGDPARKKGASYD
jgi:hypothetical protein